MTCLQRERTKVQIDLTFDFILRNIIDIVNPRNGRKSKNVLIVFDRFKYSLSLFVLLHFYSVKKWQVICLHSILFHVNGNRQKCLPSVLYVCYINVLRLLLCVIAFFRGARHSHLAFA